MACGLYKYRSHFMGVCVHSCMKVIVYICHFFIGEPHGNDTQLNSGDRNGEMPIVLCTMS